MLRLTEAIIGGGTGSRLRLWRGTRSAQATSGARKIGEESVGERALGLDAVGEPSPFSIGSYPFCLLNLLGIGVGHPVAATDVLHYKTLMTMML